MAIKTDDCDIRDTTFWMEWGGNGDPYINLMETKYFPKEDTPTSRPVRLICRFALSGGSTHKHPEVRAALIALYRAMEEAGLNKHPKERV